MDTPVLEVGSAGEWDYSFVTPNCVFYTGNRYVMYYSGGGDILAPEPRMLGMATSPDGSNWTKYDDPSTTIAFALPHASRITLQIFDITGRKIRTLISGQLSAGTPSGSVGWQG